MTEEEILKEIADNYKDGIPGWPGSAGEYVISPAKLAAFLAKHLPVEREHVIEHQTTH